MDIMDKGKGANILCDGEQLVTAALLDISCMDSCNN